MSQDIKNRFNHHPPKDQATIQAHEDVREELRVTALLLDELLPDSREKSIAITKLEEALMWANAAIARN
jgi:hypothetical protein